MKLWKIVAVSALGVSGSAFADSFGHGGGSSTPPSTVPTFSTTQWNSEIQIYQEGTGNYANADQSGVKNSLTSINQNGYHNAATTSQTGDKSLISIVQKNGGYNTANVNQSADLSKVLDSQSGWGNLSQNTQSANGSLTSVTQVGTANLAYTNQH